MICILVKTKRLDLDTLQNEINMGLSYPEISKKHKIGKSTICKYVSIGLLKCAVVKNKNGYRNGYKMSDVTKNKLRNLQTGRTLSEEIKKKISISRIKYLTKNPDKVPYLLNHSSKKSYPETIFEKTLVSENIFGWKYNYQNSIYQYDFAWEKEKLDVEIDGGTHTTEKVKFIDKRRDEFSRKNGWEVIRFTAKEVNRDVKTCVEKVKQFLMDRKH